MVYVALLRAVNVAGRSMAMSDLRAMAARAGFSRVRTILQSGNLIFETSRRAAADLEAVVEAECLARLRSETPVMVRSAAELGRIVSDNPFPLEAKRDPAHLLAVFLKSVPASENVSALSAGIVGRERVQVRGNVLYAVYPDGVGRSKLTAALIERKLATKGTGRNWNTVLKLLEACGKLA